MSDEPEVMRKQHIEQMRQQQELIQYHYQQKLMRHARWIDDILVYQEEPELKLEELIAFADRYGYDLVDVSQRYPYNQRKRPALALVDRRDKTYACVYSTKEQIKKFLDKLGS